MKSLSQEKRRYIYDMFDGKCAYCGCDILYSKFHVDHITPKYRGMTQEQMDRYGYNAVKGKDIMENYYPSCASCNSSKSAHSLEFWRKELYAKKERIKRDVPTFNLLLRFGCIVEIDKPIVFYFEKFKR